MSEENYIEPPELHALYKPSGKKVMVNDSSLEHALSVGWTKEKSKEKPKKKAD
jgi:hypothetical protein